MSPSQIMCTKENGATLEFQVWTMVIVILVASDEEENWAVVGK